MKAQQAIVTTLAAAGAVLALCPSAYFNVAPNIELAATDHSMRGMVAVQIFCVIFLAVLPFPAVRQLFSRKGHTAMVVALVAFNAMVAFQTANHRHEADTGESNKAITQSKTITANLTELRQKRTDLGTFEPAKKEQAAALQKALDEAIREKRNCSRWTCEAKEAAVTTAQNNLNDMQARVTKTDEAAVLDGQIKFWEAKKLELGYVPEHADQSSARLASLIPGASEEGVAKYWMLSVALMIEILNRFGPVSMFAFIMGGLGGHKPGESRAVVEHKPAPVPSIALPAVPRVEAAPVATVIEADEDKPAPLPPSPRKRTTTRKPERKAAQATNNGAGATVIPFSKKPSHSDVMALIADGKTQKEIAAIFECSDRTIRNILSGNRMAEKAEKYSIC